MKPIDRIPDPQDEPAPKPKPAHMATPASASVPKTEQMPRPAPTVEPVAPQVPSDEPVVPQALSDDPVLGDGSVTREGVGMSKWRVHKLKEDELVGMVEPEGRGRRARKARRAHAKSRKARTGRSRKSRGRVRVVVAMLFVLLAIGVVYAGITYSLEMWGGKTLPNVVGSSQAKAEETLAEKGFVVESTQTLADSTEGHVVSMEPEPGDRLPNGSTIYLTVAKSRIIPEVEGLSKEEAVEQLAEVGGTNIRYEWRDVLEDMDTILEVRPSAGSVFMSSDEIVLVVSQRPKVPDVVGKTESEAREVMEKQDFPVTYEYEECEDDERLMVLGTDPEAGEAVGDEGVTVRVGDPLLEVTRLADYFDAKGSHINDFLKDNGYRQELGEVSEDNHISVRYKDDEGDLMSFVSDPWSHKVEGESGSNDDVMDDGAVIEGVRLSATFAKPSSGKKKDSSNTKSDSGTSTSTESNKETTSEANASTEASTNSEPKSEFRLTNPTVGKSTANEVMERCGFSGIEGSCTQTDITLPKGTPNTGHDFYCCYGETGAYVWTVLVQEVSTGSNGGKAVKVVATCAPKSAYAVIDMSAFGNKICDFVAYWDEYAK
ncbi:MAG: PASTA domain-containing protein [Coriobacteriales bacterium]|nr:PASTA domain-containing protein [Coriobacteriales bacterium]